MSGELRTIVRGREVHRLTWQQRLSAAVFGVGLAALVTWYLLGERIVKVPASRCTDTSLDCFTRVSASPDPTVVSTFSIIAAIALLLALLGRVPEFGFGGIQASVSDQMVFGDYTTSQEATQPGVTQVKPRGPGASPTAGQRVRSRALYLELPQDIRAAAEERLNLDYPDVALSEVMLEVRRSLGRGSHPWFIKVKPSPKDEMWLRVTKGGRGRSDARASNAEAPDGS